MPLPVLNQSHSGELFPCASSGCGCDSAEKCWRTCCCHTLAERLAWAAENGVKPPDFALVEARRAGLDATGQRIVTSKAINASLATKSCCSKKRSRCSSPAQSLPAPLVPAKSCCESQSEPPQQEKSDFVVAYRALGCQGHSLQWLAAVPSLVSVELNLSDQLPLVTWLGPHSSEVAAGVSLVPTPPPPEHASLAS